MLKRFTGTISLIAALLVASPAMAVDYTVGGGTLKFGGSIRVDTGYQFTDKGDVAPGAHDSKTDFFLEDAGNTRVNLAAGYKDLNAFVELGIDSGDTYTRHAYLNYSPNAQDSFLIGRTWSLLSEDCPNQRLAGDLNLGGFGDLTSNRHDQIRYTRKLNDKMSLNLAFEDNDTDTTAGLTTNDFPYQTKENTPAILMSLAAKPSENLTLTPSLMYQRYDLERNASTVTSGSNTFTLKDQTIQTWIVALNGSLALEPLTLSFELWGGENVTNYADGMDARQAGDVYTFGAAFVDQRALANGVYDLNDTPSFGGWLQLAVPVEKLTIFTGAGYQQARPDGPASLGVEDEIHTWGAFVNCLYPVKGGFSIQPEIAYLNYGDAAVKVNNRSHDLGDDVYVGVHFQFDF